VSTRPIRPITELAIRATALIPEPPVDAVSYVAWRELVWETARRLADLSPEWPIPSPLEPNQADISSEAEGSAAHLLRLAELFRQHAAKTADDAITGTAVTCAARHHLPTASDHT
jgi:hypothetical protein